MFPYHNSKSLHPIEIKLLDIVTYQASENYRWENIFNIPVSKSLKEFNKINFPEYDPKSLHKIWLKCWDIVTSHETENPNDLWENSSRSQSQKKN